MSERPVNECLADELNSQNIVEDTPLTTREAFGGQVSEALIDGRFDALYRNMFVKLTVGQQLTLSSIGLFATGPTPLTLSVMGAGLTFASGMKYFGRNVIPTELVNDLQQDTQEKVGARYELCRQRNPGYDRQKPKDDKGNPKHAVAMYYHGAFKRHDYTTLADTQRIMALAQENNVTEVYVPAALSADLGIPDDAFANSSVHDELNKHVRLSKRTAVVDAELKKAAPEEWLNAIEKADAGTSMEGLLQIIGRINPADPLLRVWDSYRLLPQTEAARRGMYVALHNQLRAVFERQLHETEIDNAQIRAAQLSGHDYVKSMGITRLHGEVRQGNVSWRSQTGQEIDTTSVKSALELNGLADKAIKELLADPHMNPQLARRVAEFMLFESLHKRLYSADKRIVQNEYTEAPSVYDHRDGIVAQFAKNIRKTREHHRGKPLALRIGALAAGAMVSLGPALAGAQLVKEPETSGGLASRKVGNIGDTNGGNRRNWSFEEHGAEAAGYWGAATSQNLIITQEDGRLNFVWNDVVPTVESSRKVPRSVPSNASRYIEVGHQMAVGDAGMDEGGWSMRLPVRQGMDVIAAAMGNHRLSVQHRKDGTIWLHGAGESPTTADKLTYWLAEDPDAPKPKAIGEAYVIDDVAGKNPRPADILNKHLPEYVQRGNAVENLKKYIALEWEYDLNPLPELDKERPLESFIVKALAAKKASCTVANTLETLYDFKHQRAVADGYRVGAEEDGLYSHDAHMWTVDDKGTILDATPTKGAEKFADYFSTDEEYWNPERISGFIMIGSFTLSGMVVGGTAMRPRIGRLRYENILGRSQAVHTSLDIGAVRRTIATVQQLLYAPSFDLTAAQLQAEKSTKTGAHLIDEPHVVLVSPATEALIREQLDQTEDSGERIALQEVVTTIRAARKLGRRKQKLADKAERLRKKLPKPNTE